MHIHPDDIYDGECVIFSGYLNKKGYGQKHVNRKPVYAHRLAYCESKGINLSEIEGLVIRHKCDNPSCVNPEHLIVGTQADNNRDRKRRGRSVSPNRHGENNGRAKLTKLDVINIRDGYVRGCVIKGLKGLSGKYGVSTTMIADIINRKNWSHISEV